jgi:CHAT domain-containing protein
MLTDVLALQTVPRLVILSACDSARTQAPGGGSLGLAQAFVLAGAAAVIAPTRPVADAGAKELMAAVYRQLADDPRLDLALALGRAQSELAARSAPGDWASFRAFVP